MHFFFFVNHQLGSVWLRLNSNQSKLQIKGWKQMGAAVRQLKGQAVCSFTKILSLICCVIFCKICRICSINFTWPNPARRPDRSDFQLWNPSVHQCFKTLQFQNQSAFFTDQEAGCSGGVKLLCLINQKRRSGRGNDYEVWTIVRANRLALRLL